LREKKQSLIVLKLKKPIVPKKIKKEKKIKINVSICLKFGFFSEILKIEIGTSHYAKSKSIDS